jgi:hypothetical protein
MPATILTGGRLKRNSRLAYLDSHSPAPSFRCLLAHEKAYSNEVTSANPGQPTRAQEDSLLPM